MFVRQNLVYGKLDAELGAVATTISSSALAGLVVVAAPDRVRVVLDPQGQFGVPELVDVTAHTVDATSATVVRAVEDSGRLSARVHPVGTRWAVVDTVESLPVAAIDSGVVAGGARIAVVPPDWLEETPGSVSITSQALVDDPNPNPGPDELTGDEVPGDGGTQVGPAAWAEGYQSSAVGGYAWAEGNRSSAVGWGAWAEHADSVALGANTRTTAVDQVHIGDRHLMSDAGRAVVSEEANVIKVVDETGWGAIVSPDADTIYFVVEDTL